MPFRLGTNRIGRLVVGATFDADAQAFFNASGITDATTKDAINTLVTDLKSAGTANGGTYWDNLIAFYPFAGTTATQQSYNLKDPTQYQITWNGTVTHNSSGATGDGSTGYGDTGWSPTNDLDMWSGAKGGAIGFYSQTTTTVNSTMMGAGASGTNSNSRLMIFYFNGQGYVDWGDKAAGNNANRITSTNWSQTGNIIATSENDIVGDSVALRGYRNGSFFGGDTETLSTTKSVEPDTNMLIFARSNSLPTGINGFNSDTLSSAFISYWIDNTEVAAFSTIVNDYQTAMGRNTY